MNRKAVFVAMVSVMGCAAGPSVPPATVPHNAPAPASPPAGNLFSRIPATIGAFSISERTAVTGTPSDSLYRFRDTSKTNLSVFVYDVPSDVKVDSDAQKWTVREGDKFKLVQDIRRSRGQIAAFVVAFSDTSRFVSGGQTILEHSIAVPTRLPNGVILVELQYLYQISGKFVKVRATIPEPGWQQTRVPSFARELARRAAGGS